MNDIEIDSIKIGMIYNYNIIKKIKKILLIYKNKKVPIIFDPVIYSTTGKYLIPKKNY